MGTAPSETKVHVWDGDSNLGGQIQKLETTSDATGHWTITFTRPGAAWPPCVQIWLKDEHDVCQTSVRLITFNLS